MTLPDHAAMEQAARDEAQQAGRIALSAGLLRLLLFAALAWAAAGAVAAPGPWPVLGGVLILAFFLGVGLWQQGHDDRRRRAEAQAEYHRRGGERLQGRWRHGQDDGSSWTLPDHPWAQDLDVLGPHSLYELLNSAGSAPGRQQLARWLLDDPEPELAAQASLIQALASHHRWRAELAAAAADGDDAGARALAEALRAWLATPPGPPAKLLTAALWTGRLIGPAILALLAWQLGAEGFWLGYLGVAPLWLLGDRLALRRRGGLQVAAALPCCRAWAAALERLAAVPDEGLAELAAEAQRASQELSALVARLRAAAAGGNPLRALLLAPLLPEWQAELALEAWARRHGAAFADWLACLGRGEALACLASYAAEQGGCVATLADDGPAIAAVDLQHPLLARDSRVGNDLQLEAGQVLLLTGANASGKSTLLRAVALAMLLARIGAPVPATSCQLRPLRLATAMRIGDDLARGRSRFQAEVARLRSCLERADEGPSLLVFDEILGGTNSRERHLGTRALLRHLRCQRGLLLVSTHDLELVHLQAEDPQRIVLAHFADRAALGEAADDADVVFDYRLRPGAVTSTNALRVMRRMGLPVDPDKC